MLTYATVMLTFKGLDATERDRANAALSRRGFVKIGPTETVWQRYCVPGASEIQLKGTRIALALALWNFDYVANITIGSAASAA